MYDAIWQIIQSGEYRLEEINEKIYYFYAVGQLTAAQRDELLALAVEHLDPERERPEVQDMLNSLAARVTALEEWRASQEGDGGTDYPEWEKWDGTSSNYQYGAIVSHNGKLWISTYNGQNVWEPGLYGWEEYTPESEE